MAYTDSLPFWPVGQALPLDGGFFFFDPNSGLEYRVAPEMLAGSAATQGVAELRLPQPVVAEALYLTPTGVWAARRSFNAAAAPVAGANWRLVLAAGTPDAAAGLLDDHYTASVTGAQPAIVAAGALKFFNVVAGGVELTRGEQYSDDGRGTLTITAGVTAGQRVQYCWLTGALAAGVPQFNPIAAGRYGQHPAFQGQYGDQGVNAFLLAQLVQLQQAAVGAQPAAPTAGQVDDTGDTFSFVANPLFPSPGQSKVAGLPGTSGPVYLDDTNSYVAGGRTYVKVVGAVGVGGLAVYVAGTATRPDGLPLANKEPFTGSAVVTPPPTTTTYTGNYTPTAADITAACGSAGGNGQLTTRTSTENQNAADTAARNAALQGITCNVVTAPASYENTVTGGNTYKGVTLGAEASDQLEFNNASGVDNSPITMELWLSGVQLAAVPYENYYTGKPFRYTHGGQKYTKNFTAGRIDL